LFNPGHLSDAVKHDISHEARHGVSSRNNPSSYIESADKVANKGHQVGIAKTLNHFNITQKLAGVPLQVHLSSDKKKPEKAKD
jgi:hypothetical protein